MYTLYNGICVSELEPSEFYLSPNYPNPFKKKTTIKYCVAYRTKVLLTVYNEKNDKIIKLVDEVKNPGTYEVEFHSLVGGKELDAGVYYCCLKAGNYKSENKMVIKK